MKCPYRTKIKYIKPVNKTFFTSQGEIMINLIKTEDYEECYGEDCPFYCDDGTRREPYCARIENEIGGECL